LTTVLGEPHAHDPRHQRRPWHRPAVHAPACRRRLNGGRGPRRRARPQMSIGRRRNRSMMQAFRLLRSVLFLEYIRHCGRERGAAWTSRGSIASERR
jgi:hypothetical protein